MSIDESMDFNPVPFFQVVVEIYTPFGQMDSEEKWPRANIEKRHR
jgi:hypothetical protein